MRSLGSIGCQYSWPFSSEQGKEVLGAQSSARFVVYLPFNRPCRLIRVSTWFNTAINAAKSLGVEPPNQLKAKHYTDPNIEHISVMAFLTKLMQISDKRARIRIIGLNLNNVFVNKEVVLSQYSPFALN